MSRTGFWPRLRVLVAGAYLLQLSTCLGGIEPGFFAATTTAQTVTAFIVTQAFNLLLAGLGGTGA